MIIVCRIKIKKVHLPKSFFILTKGGYREGSGRKAFCEDSVSVHWRVSEYAKSWMKQKAVEDGVSIGAVLDKLIKHYDAVNSASR